MRNAVCIFVILFLACNGQPAKKIPVADPLLAVIPYPLPGSVDSLLLIINKAGQDTNRVNVLNALSWELNDGNSDTAIILSMQALKLAEKLQWKKGIAKSLHELGWFNYTSGQLEQAKDHFERAITIRIELNDKAGLAASYGNLGSVYKDKADYPSALGYYLRALKLNEELKNLKGQQINLGNIGSIYWKQRDFPKAISYYTRAKTIATNIGDEKSEARHTGNLGLVYSDMKDSARAFACYFRALAICEKLNIRSNVSTWNCNIGTEYADHGQPEKAEYYFRKALTIAEELENPSLTGEALNCLGSLHFNTGDHAGALKEFQSARDLFSGNGDRYGLMNSFGHFYEVFSSSSKPLPDSSGKLLDPAAMRIYALRYFKRYTALRDSLFSEENDRQLVQKELTYEFDKQSAAAKAENDKKEALSKVELKRKETERNYFIAGFILVIILAAFILRGYRRKKKANGIIAHQKSLVEEKQKEILDSIHYASRIQNSLLPSEKFISLQLSRTKERT